MRVGDSVLDDFVIEERVVASDDAVVFRGREVESAEPVAIEVLLGLEAPVLERFARDAESLGALAKSETVSYLAHGTSDAGEAIVVLDWIGSEAPAARLARLAAIRAELATPRTEGSGQTRTGGPNAGRMAGGRAAVTAAVKQPIVYVAAAALVAASIAAISYARRREPERADARAIASSSASTSHAGARSSEPEETSAPPSSTAVASLPSARARSSSKPMASAIPCSADVLACAPLDVPDATNVETFTLIPQALELAQSVRPYAQLAEVRATGVSRGTLDFTHGASATFGMTAGLVVEAKGKELVARPNPVDFAWPVRITRCSVSLAYAAATMAGLPRTPPASLSFGGENVQDRLYFTVSQGKREQKVYVDPRTCTGNGIGIDLYDPYGH